MSGLSLTAATVSDLIADINAANTAGGANTITLAKNNSPNPRAIPFVYVLTAVNNGTYGATGLPVIAANDNLTIVGNGDTIERSTAVGALDFRLLAVASGGLTLDNLTLQSGAETNGPIVSGITYAGGGAIFNYGGTLVLNDVTVQHNFAAYSGGGAIFNYGGTLVLNDVTVQHNGAAYAGGGIFSSNGSVTLEGGTIVQNNVATGGGGGGGEAEDLGTGGTPGYGGGLYALLGPGGTVTVTNTTLDNNDAGYGGGLYVFNLPEVAGSAVSLVSLSNDTIKSNNAEFEGGGLYVEGANVTLSYDMVESNSAGYDDGGGLYVDGGNVTLSNDTVESNSAGYGGGLYVNGYPGGIATVTLSNDTVESNTARFGYGGGIYINYGTVYLDSFTVANTINNTDNSGLNGSTANIDGTYILQNP